jgi:hypothetical protein
VASIFSWLAMAVILLSPPASMVAVVAVLVWTTKVRRRRMAPGFVVWTAYALATVAGLAIGSGLVGALRAGSSAMSGEGLDPSQKARALAEGISELMNCGAFGLLVAVAGAGWLGVWSWILARRSR